MLQFMLGCIGLVYALSLLSVENPFMNGEEIVDEKYEEETDVGTGSKGNLNDPVCGSVQLFDFDSDEDDGNKVTK